MGAAAGGRGMNRLSYLIHQGSPRIQEDPRGGMSNIAKGFVYDPNTGNAYSDVSLEFRTKNKFEGQAAPNRYVAKSELYGSKQYLIYSPEGGQREEVDITDRDIFGINNDRKALLGTWGDQQLAQIDAYDTPNLNAQDKEYWQHKREQIPQQVMREPFRYGAGKSEGLPINTKLLDGSTDLFARPEFSSKDLQGIFKAFAPKSPKFSNAPNAEGPIESSAPVFTTEMSPTTIATSKSLAGIRRSRRPQSNTVTGSILDPQGNIGG